MPDHQRRAEAELFDERCRIAGKVARAVAARTVRLAVSTLT
jgi:hypothetical protein